MPRNYSGGATQYEVVDSLANQSVTVNGRKMTNPGDARGMVFTVAITNAGTSPTLVVKLQWSPDGGTTWVDWDTTNLQTTSQVAIGTVHLRVYPGLTTAANAARNDALPPFWRAVYTIGGTTPAWTLNTYANYLV